MTIEEGRADYHRPPRPGDLSFPVRRNASPGGWLDDQDRDSAPLIMIRALSEHIDRLAEDFRQAPDTDRALAIATLMVEAWERLREVQR